MASQGGGECFEASNGARIYRIPLEVFPGYWAFSHFVTHEGKSFLVDVGSGFGASHPGLMAGLKQIESDYSVPASLDRLDAVIITHGHVDHFGGLGTIRQAAPQARIAIHELARPVLVNYDERVLVASQRMRQFLERAGVPPVRHKSLLDLYMLGKRAFAPQSVDVTLTDGQQFEDIFEVIHVPGHEPGLVMLRIGDTLLTADHVLPNTSVALAPESIMPFTGVAHYLESLDKAARLRGVKVALGGHEQPMADFEAVVNKTRASALDKVDRVLAECAEPSTIYDIATRIYGQMDGYSELLKLGQTGARIEYLNQRAKVIVDNLSDLEDHGNPVLRYRQE